MTNKNLSLESLRGFAAIAVSILHFPSVSLIYNNPFVFNAIWMVDFFFVLSGYVIALNYFHRLKRFEDVLSFQIKRFWRLYPLHFFMLMVFLGIELTKFIFEYYTGVQANNPPFEKNNLAAFIHNVFLTHSIFMNWFTFNQPSWSISTEFYAYAVFALLTITLRKYLIIFIIIFVAVDAYLLHFEYSLLESTTFRPFFRCLYSFFIGVLVWFITTQYSLKTKSLLPLTVLLIAIFAVMYMPESLRAVIPFIFGAVIYLISDIEQDCLLNKFLSHKIPLYLGTISYSIYMTHSAVWWVISQILRFAFDVNTRIDKMGNTAIALDENMATIVTLFGIFCILVVSHFTFHHIENRFRKGLKKKSRA